jgi:hypothetical protein
LQELGPSAEEQTPITSPAREQLTELGDVNRCSIRALGAVEDPCLRPRSSRVRESLLCLRPGENASNGSRAFPLCNVPGVPLRRIMLEGPTPSKAEKFYSGASPSGLNIDSQGNAWITTRFGNGVSGKLHLVELDVRGKIGGLVHAMDYLTMTMSTQQGGTDRSGSVTLLRPDGTPYPGPHSRAVVCLARGQWLWTEMTTSGFPTLRCQTARSCNCAVFAPRPVRPA